MFLFILPSLFHEMAKNHRLARRFTLQALPQDLPPAMEFHHFGADFNMKNGGFYQ